MNLDQLASGQKATVIQFHIKEIGIRMMSLGILPNSTIEVVRKSPLNDALYIKSGNMALALRRDEAKQIKIKL